MNQIILIGNLGADIELKTTNSGKYVASVNMAVKDDFNREKTDWIPLVFWNKSAETAAQYLHKGSKIAVVGKLSARNYEDKEGKKRTAYEVVVERFEFLESKKADAPASFGKMEVVDENPDDPTFDLPF
jgi:single-strand DNA-binding protein